MINKNYKIINNKFHSIIRFIFFIRYLFLIFFVAIVLFFTIPHFFDFEKKKIIIHNYLLDNYGLEIESFEKIKYNSLPIPHLQINDLSANLYSNQINLQTKRLLIYPNFLSIYNFRNFHLKKTKLENGILDLNYSDLNTLSKNILKQKKKIQIKNLDLEIKDKNNQIINLKGINYSNFGYKKNNIHGEVFKRKFKIFFDKNLKNINFKLLDTGISAKLNILENNTDSKINGTLKGKILQSTFKINFSYDENAVIIKNLFFRDKKLSFNSNGYLKFKPFFKTKLSTEINDIDINILKNLDIKNILNSKDLIKKINTEKKIEYTAKKFKKSIIKDLKIETNLAYGRLNIFKDFSTSASRTVCKSNVNLFDEYPVMFFNCTFNSSNKKEFLKQLDIKYKKKNEYIKIKMTGNLNILNKKINFEKLEVNNDYKATQEDLNFFKISFEEILFDGGFLKIFDITKIKKFIKEVT